MSDIANQFENVSSGVLRHILRREPWHLKTLYVRQAVDMTLDALGRDVIDPAVPVHALEIRIEAAREAKRALDRGQRKRAHAGLQGFWMA